jgi:hypothetical protein
MFIVVNGQPYPLHGPQTLAALLVSLSSPRIGLTGNFIPCYSPDRSLFRLASKI